MPSISTIVAVTFFFAIVLAVTARPITTAVTTVYMLGAILLSSWVKLTHLGLALTLADIHFFSLRPIENFKLFFQYPLLGVLLLAVILGVAICVWAGIRRERPWTALGESRKHLRTAMAATSIAFVGTTTWIAAPAAQKRVDNGDSYVAFLAMYESQHPDGVIGLLNVFFNNRSFEPTMPPPREQKRFSLPQAEGTQGETAVGTFVKPDIFLILEESTFDPTLILKCPAAYCDNAMLHPLRSARRTEQGPLLVHTTGGGTWLAEFSVMSGLDWRVFGRGGGYAPVSLAPRLTNAMPQYLRSLGYRTVAIYPTAGNFLSARKAYERYGFDEFYDIADLHLPDEWGDTHDSMVFDKALGLAERANDSRPVFVFALTIRNHGPHGPPKMQVPKSFAPVSKALNEEMGDFLARMRDSSNDLVQLADRWLKSSRPRVLAWFGDHQPEAAWNFTEHPEDLDSKRLAPNVPQQQTMYITQYQFSANFGDRGQSIGRNALDLSYLGAELLTFSDVPLNPGMKVARTVASECQGLMFDCADRQLIADYVDFRIYGLHAIE